VDLAADIEAVVLEEDMAVLDIGATGAIVVLATYWPV